MLNVNRAAGKDYTRASRWQGGRKGSHKQTEEREIRSRTWEESNEQDDFCAEVTPPSNPSHSEKQAF